MVDNPNYSKYDLGPTRRDGKERPRTKKRGSDEHLVPTGSSAPGSNLQYNLNGNNNGVRHSTAAPPGDVRYPPSGGDAGSADRRYSSDDVNTLDGAHYKRFADLNANTPEWVEQATDTELLERVHRSFRQIKKKWTPNTGQRDPTSSSIASNQADKQRSSRLRTGDTQKSKPLQRAVRWMIVVAVIIVLAVAIAIPVWIFTSKDDSKSERSLQRFDLLSTVSNEVYSTAMADPSSNEFKQFAAAFCQGIEDRLVEYNKDYRGCVVNELKNGSVVVSYSIVVLASADVTKESLITVITASSTTGSSGTAMFQIGSFLLPTASTTVVSSTAISADDNPVAPRALFGVTCTPEGKTIGCQTLGATCLSTCACSQHQYYNQPTDECALIDCGPVPTISNGSAAATKGSNYSSPLTIQCDDGYELSNDTTITCQTHNTWPGNLPSCNKIQCASLPTPEHASLDTSKTHGNTYGDTKTFVCDDDYTMVGDAIVTCQSNKTWSNVPSCTAIGCNDYMLPTNSKLNTAVSGGESVGDTKTVVCDEGYSLQGDATVTCLPNKEWGVGPTCEPKKCTDFNLPANAILDPSSHNGSSVKETKTLMCKAGYTMTGEPVVTCKVDQTWSESPICNRVSCGTYQTPPHAIVDQSSGGGTLFGDTVTLDCDTGYKIRGNATVTCHADGNWTTPSPVCESITCSDYTLPANAKLNQTASDNETKILVCESGYTMNGAAVVTCQDDETWSMSPTCDPVSCGEYQPPPHGTVDQSGGTLYGDTLTIECEAGYTVDGDATVACNVDAKWTNPGPTCEPKNCSNFTPPTNAKLDPSAHDGTSFNETKTLVCEDGYTMTGEAVVRCKADQTWSESPTCNRVSCGTYQAPPKAIVDQSSGGGTLYGDIVTVDCEAGYKVSDNAIVTCNADGNWSEPGPTCEPKNCSSFTPATNAKLDPSAHDGTSFKETKTLVCEEGYNLIGDAVVTCQANQSWTESPTCDPVSCGVYQSPPNVEVDQSTGSTANTYGDTISVLCDDGYSISGNPTVRCNADATWSLVTCLANKCNKLNLPTNANFSDSSINGTNMFYGTFFEITCQAGTVFTGKNNFTCNPDGTWNTFECVSVGCNTTDLKVPENGNIASGNATVLVITCNKGYSLHGGRGSITCENGQWGDYPECVLVNCGDPPYIDQADITFTDTTFNSIATVECKTGYTMNGTGRMQCLETGNWSSTTTCHVVSCGDPEIPENSAITSNSSVTVYGSKIQIECEHGFTRTGSNIIECLANSTWSSGPTCDVIDCGKFIPPSNSSVPEDVGTHYGDSTNVTCDTGFEMTGDASVVCQLDGQWSESPICLIINCSTPISPDKGTVSLTSGSLVFNSTATVTCETGYRVVGNHVITCQASGQWTDNPICEFIDCGPNITPPLNGNISYIKETSYNSTALILCNTGFAPDSNATITCDETGSWSTGPSCIPVDCGSYTPNDRVVISEQTGTVYESVIKLECSSGSQPVAGANMEVTCQADQLWSTGPECSKVGLVYFSQEQYVFPIGNEGLIQCNISNTPGWSMIAIFRSLTFEADDLQSAIFHVNQTGGTYASTSQDRFTETAMTSFTADGATIELKLDSAQCDDGGEYECGVMIDDATAPDNEPDFKTNSSFVIVKDTTLSPSLQVDPSLVMVNRTLNIVCTGNVTTGKEGDSTIDMKLQVKYQAEEEFETIVDGVNETSTDISCYRQMRKELSVTATTDWDKAVVRCLTIDLGSQQLTSDSVTITVLANCGDPSTVMNGNVTVSEDEIHATVECMNGYLLEASANISCQQNGQWSTAPNCDIADCGAIDSLENGHVVQNASETTYNATAIFGCDVGYDMTGSSNVTCLSHGAWSAMPLCVLVDCGQYSPPDNSQIENSTGTSYSSTVYIKCDDGYYPFDDDHTYVSCDEDGNWTSAEDTLVACNTIGSVKFSSDNYSVNANTNLTIECNIRNAANWTMVAIAKPDFDGDMLIVVENHNPTDLNEEDHVTLSSQSDVTSQNDATIYIEFTPVRCNDTGYYTCGVMLGNGGQEATLDNSKTDSTYIHVQC